MQLQLDPKKQPLEDTSVEWREEDSPFVPVGMISLPQVDLLGTSPVSIAAAGREAYCNALAFTPWHGLETNRPLCNIMRARKPVYMKSAEFRNGRGEPTLADIERLPR